MQQQLALHAISNGHARALLGLSNPEDQIQLCQDIIMHDYSVRKIEEIIKDISKSSDTSSAKGKKSNPLKAVLHGFWAFFRTYIIRVGFLDGAQGFALAISNAFSMLEITKS